MRQPNLGGGVSISERRTMTKISSFRNKPKKNRKSNAPKASELKLVAYDDDTTEQQAEAIITPFTEIQPIDILMSVAAPSKAEIKTPELYLLAKASQSFNKHMNLGDGKGAKQANMLSPKGMSKTERIKQNRVWSSRKDS